MSSEPSTAITRRTYGATVSVELPRAAAEVADDERRIDEAEHGPQKERRRRTARREADPIRRPPIAKNSCDFARRRAQHAAQPPLVLPGAACRGHLLAR